MLRCVVLLYKVERELCLMRLAQRSIDSSHRLQEVHVALKLTAHSGRGLLQLLGCLFVLPQCVKRCEQARPRIDARWLIRQHLLIDRHALALPFSNSSKRDCVHSFVPPARAKAHPPQSEASQPEQPAIHEKGIEPGGKGSDQTINSFCASLFWN